MPKQERPLSISTLVRVMHDFQKSGARIAARIEDPVTQKTIAAGQLFTTIEGHDTQGAVDKRYWTLNKWRLPASVKTMYFFTYGGDMAPGMINVTFNKSCLPEQLLEYLCENTEGLEIEKQNHAYTIKHRGIPAMTTTVNAKRFILHPLYIEGSKRRYDLNETALDLIDCVDGYRSAVETGAESIQVTMRQQLLLLPVMSMQENLQQARGILQSKVLSASDQEIRDMMAKYL